MSQPFLWSDPPTYPDQFRSPDLSSSVHTQESDHRDHDPSWRAKHEDLFSTPERIKAHNHRDSIAFRHSGWASTRNRVALALQDSDAPASRVMAFDECGSRAYVLESLTQPGHYRIVSSKCKDRFCKPCARERAGRVARSLLDHVEHKELRFITLTLKTQTPNLRFELDRLYKAFQALRRRKFWRAHVAGGAALLEVKHNADKDRWHPHLHILVEGRYVPHTKLADEWRHATGDSFVVDIRAVKDNARVTHYICKYATDPIDRSIGKSVELLTQAIDAFRGRKSCLTFGTWRGVLLVDKDDETGWRHIASLNQLLWDAKDGSEHARKILASLWTYLEATEKNRRPHQGRSRPPPPDAPLFP